MLSTDFHFARRQQLLAQLKPNSVCIIPAASLVTRSRDTEYTFRQDSDFWYLTGFHEPDAWLILSNSDEYNGHYALLACQPKDELAEVWQGRRVGPIQALKQYQMDDTCSVEEIVCVLTEMLNGHTHLYFALAHNQIAEAMVLDVMSDLRAAPKQSKIAPSSILDIRPFLNEMRLFKSNEELAIMQRAGEISARAHCRAMRAVHSAEYEYQLEAEILHEFAYAGARNAAYSSIVGSGENACILHYTENSDPLQAGDLVLIDAGAELHGYAADITRTFPVNGVFSIPQARLYQLVLDAQLAALAVLKPGATIAESMQACLQVLVAGLVDLNILKGSVDTLINEKAYQPFFMHGLGHWLGLDVHDVGDYKRDQQERRLEAGMVMTVEPGLYIASNADVPPEFAGIGIRIEDNIVITENGYQLLTHGVPKTIAEIEALIQQAKYE